MNVESGHRPCAQQVPLAVRVGQAVIANVPVDFDLPQDVITDVRTLILRRSSFRDNSLCTLDHGLLMQV
jgi:hypothetical protein